MELIKENQKWKTYKADKCKIFYRYKWTVAWNNSENEEELIYLINWEAKVTIEDKETVFKAPAEIKIPEKTYHKIEAITDISFILF